MLDTPWAMPWVMTTLAQWVVSSDRVRKQYWAKFGATREHQVQRRLRLRVGKRPDQLITFFSPLHQFRSLHSVCPHSQHHKEIVPRIFLMHFVLLLSPSNQHRKTSIEPVFLFIYRLYNMQVLIYVQYICWKSSNSPGRSLDSILWWNVNCEIMSTCGNKRSFMQKNVGNDAKCQRNYKRRVSWPGDQIFWFTEIL